MALFPVYASLAELRAFARITDVTDTGDDVFLSMALEAASRAVDEATDRQFGSLSSAAARYYTATFDPVVGRWRIPIDDLMDVTGLVVKADMDWNDVYETTITDYRLWPLEAAGLGRPWNTIVFGPFAALAYTAGAFEVTAKWGWSAVPDTIKNATLLQASRFYKRRDSPYGIAGSPDMGNELRLLAKLDPDVAVMVQPFRLWQMVSTTR
jgi:hypothetical protein